MVCRIQHLSKLFSERLRELCDQQASYAHVARELGINRQQLSRYLSGTSMPRDGILTAFANFFSIPVSQLFSENPIITTGNDFSSELLVAITQLFGGATLENITSDDIEEGFYRQYKTSFTHPGKIFVSLVMVKMSGNICRYKRCSSVAYMKSLPGTNIKNTFEGLFLKQNGNIALIDRGSLLGDLTFHVLETRFYYNLNIKHGYHVKVSGSAVSKLVPSPFVLEKFPKNESVLDFARNQGFWALDRLPQEIVPFFQNDQLGLVTV